MKNVVAFDPRQSAFTPKLLPNLGAWWDFSDVSTLSINTGRVSAAVDKSGSGRNLQPLEGTGTTWPPFSPNSQNGLSAISGTSSVGLKLAVPYNLVAAATYIFAVVSAIDALNSNIFLPSDTVGFNNFYLSLDKASGGRLVRVVAGTLTNLTAVGPGASDNTAHVVSTIITPTGTEMSFDAASGNFAGTGAPPISGLSNHSNDASKLHGRVMEVIIGTALLSEFEKASVKRYLRTKWGTP